MGPPDAERGEGRANGLPPRLPVLTKGERADNTPQIS
jgi:hypothetical protein